MACTKCSLIGQVTHPTLIGQITPHTLALVRFSTHLPPPPHVRPRLIARSSHTQGAPHLTLACLPACAGLRCLELLRRYYQGELHSLGEDDEEEEEEVQEEGKRSKKGRKEGRKGSRKGGAADEENGHDEDGRGKAGADAASLLLTEKVKPRAGMPPLLVNLADRKPERLHYLGECGS